MAGRTPHEPKGAGIGAKAPDVFHAPTLLPRAGPPNPVPVPGDVEADPTALAVSPPAPPGQPAPGLLLDGRYRLGRRIGAGGMGEVWEGVHTAIRRRVAVKILTSPRDGPDGNRVTERFLREAQIIAAVEHRNVVEITDFGALPDGRPYYVMEFLAGKTLAQRVKSEGPLPWTETCVIVSQVAAGLTAVHERGVVHRDLKPDNIFLVSDDEGGVRVKIIDFGIAKTNRLDPSARTFTKTGMVFGTPAFMSPEQARGEKVDLRADVYALGCVAFYAVTGRLPFPAENAAKMLFHHLFTEPSAPSRFVSVGGVPPSFDAFVLRCMRKEPDNRFRTMHEVLDAVARIGPTAACVPVPEESSISIDVGSVGSAGEGGELDTDWGRMQAPGGGGAAVEGGRSSGKAAPTGYRWGVWLGAAGIAAAVGVTVYRAWYRSTEPSASLRDAPTGPAAAVGAAAPDRPEKSPGPSAEPGAGEVAATGRAGAFEGLAQESRSVFDGVEVPADGSGKAEGGSGRNGVAAPVGEGTKADRAADVGDVQRDAGRSPDRAARARWKERPGAGEGAGGGVGRGPASKAGGPGASERSMESWDDLEHPGFPEGEGGGPQPAPQDDVPGGESPPPATPAVPEADASAGPAGEEPTTKPRPRRRVGDDLIDPNFDAHLP